MPGRNEYYERLRIVIQALFPQAFGDVREALVWLFADVLMSLDAMTDRLTDAQRASWLQLAKARALKTPSLEEMLACAKRELALRKNVYPKGVKAGRYTADHAMRETVLMQAIVDHFTGLIEAIAGEDE